MNRFPRRLDLERSAAAIVGLCFAVTLWQSYTRATIPFEMNYGEGNVLSAGVRVLSGSTPYPDPATFPYALNPYGPVGYLLTAVGLRVFGVSLFGPRLLVLLAGTVIVFVFSGFTRRSGSRWGIGFLMGVFFLSTPLARLWFPLLRVDYWAVLFSLLGLLAFLSFRRTWFVAVILFALAVLTKITAVAAPLACVAELVLQRRLKRAFAMAAGVAGVFVACALYRGSSLSFHQFQTHPEPYSIARALDLCGYGVTSCLLAVGVIVYAVAPGFRFTPANRLGWLYLAACSATTFTAGNLGSDTNHLLEWSAAVCLVAGLALGHLLVNRDSLAKPIAFGLVGMVVFWAWQIAQSPTESKRCADAYAFIRLFPGNRVLSEDITALILAGKPVLVSDPYMMTQLGSSVKWSKGSMEQLAAQKYFDLIVLGGEIDAYKPESGRWPPALMGVIRQRYRLVRRLDCPPCLRAAYAPKTAGNAKR